MRSAIDVGTLVRLTQVDDRLPNEPSATAGVGRLSLVAAGAVGVAALVHPPADPRGQVGALLEGDDRAPQGRLQGLALPLEEALGGVGVADPAPEPEQVALVLLPEGAAALRAGELRRLTVLGPGAGVGGLVDRKSTRLNSSHTVSSYAVF